MDLLPLEITSMSAEGLKSVNLFSTMDVYGVVSIAGTPSPSQSVPVDKDAGSNPRWKDLMLRFNVSESAAVQQNLAILFVLISKRFFGNREIGRVYVPLRELIEVPAQDKRSTGRQVTYQVRTVSGKAKGVLTFMYRFGEKVPSEAAANRSDVALTSYPPHAAPPPPHGSAVKGTELTEPVMAYPPPANGGAYYSPPPYPPAGPAAYPAYSPAPQMYQPGYGYPPPGNYPAPAYGYQPPAGYGYGPPVASAAPKKSKMGMGLGIGAGLLGGMLIGDMVSDIGDAGYDSGMGDVGFGF